MIHFGYTEHEDLDSVPIFEMDARRVIYGNMEPWHMPVADPDAH